MSSSCQCLRIKRKQDEKKGTGISIAWKAKVKKVILLVNKALRLNFKQFTKFSFITLLTNESTLLTFLGY